MSTQNDRAAWLKGGGAKCCTAPQPKGGRAYRLVLLGAPGVGKGTQAEILTKELGACQLSTGDIFRAMKTLKPEELSPALKQAQEFMRRGELVPDETVISLVRERVKCVRCPGGFLLDGFPRTVAQAESLDKLLTSENVKLDAVLSYEMPIEEIVARLSGRRTCAGCKAVYHVTNRPPKKDGVCDHCGGKLFQRDDDQPQAIRVRMEVYQKSTAPLAEYYQRKGLLVTISAAGNAETVYQRTQKALAGRI